MKSSLAKLSNIYFVLLRNGITETNLTCMGAGPDDRGTYKLSTLFYNQIKTRYAPPQYLHVTRLLPISNEASPTIWSCYANLNHYHYSFL